MDTDSLTPLQEAEHAGFDLSLLDANLSYSYERRVLLNDATLELAAEFERAGQRLYAAAESSAKDADRR